MCGVRRQKNAANRSARRSHRARAPIRPNRNAARVTRSKPKRRVHARKRIRRMFPFPVKEFLPPTG